MVGSRMNERSSTSGGLMYCRQWGRQTPWSGTDHTYRALPIISTCSSGWQPTKCLYFTYYFSNLSFYSHFSLDSSLLNFFLILGEFLSLFYIYYIYKEMLIYYIILWYYINYTLYNLCVLYIFKEWHFA